MALATRPTATLFGGATTSADYLIGSFDDDIITGGADASVNDPDGVDTMVGSGGDDMYIVNDTTDAIIELADQGIDTVYTTVNYTLASEVENGAAVPLDTPAGITLTGNTKNNRLDGTQNSAADTLVGLTGNDIYYLGTGDLVTEQSNAGTDTIVSAATVTLGTTTTTGLNIENVILAGSTAVNISGNALANQLTGNSAINTITGGSGNDTIDGGIDSAADQLTGGLGDDVYIYRSGDVVNESASQGTDTVKVTATGYTLADNVENLILLGTVAAGTGNSGNNTLTGNASNNTLNGGNGADTLIGNAGVDTLNGGSGADRLDGGAGADTMVGGADNDTYVVDDAGDVVTEGTSAGTDTIQSSVTLTAFVANIENIVLTGSSAINATSEASNATNTTISGNGGNNVLTGGDGNDSISGNAGVDTLNGGDGNDTLTGGTGADVLTGGNGNDIYVVDSNTESSNITEASGVGSGTDTVQSTVTITTLATNVENITLTGTSLISATGNAANNTLTGNSAANTLTGSGDSDTDTYFGLGGTDTIVGDDGVDIITGGAGKDTVTTGAGADIIKFAAGVADTVVSGSSGNNSINGVDVYGDLVLNAAVSDTIDLTVAVATVGTAVSGAVSTLTFVSNMNNLLNDLGVGFNPSIVGGISAAVVTATSGTLSGHKFLAVDLNHDDAFSVSDFVIEITGSTVTSLTTATFV